MARYFTPEEANAALTHVRPLVERLVEARRTMREAQEREEELRGRIAGNGGGIDPGGVANVEEEVEHAAEQVARLVDEIHEHGAQVKDLDVGLIDFPALHRGDEVLLCWRLGEETIAYWHGLEEGFRGRKPLPFD